MNLILIKVNKDGHLKNDCADDKTKDSHMIY